MNTCDTCRWWGKETDEPEMRECNAAIGLNDSNDGFGVANGEPFNSGNVATQAKFGCIHHEPKEPS